MSVKVSLTEVGDTEMRDSIGAGAMFSEGGSEGMVERPEDARQREEGLLLFVKRWR